MRFAEKCMFVNRLQCDRAHTNSIPVQSISTLCWTKFHCVRLFCGWHGFLLTVSLLQCSRLIVILLLSKGQVGEIWEPFRKAMLFRISWSTGQRSTVTSECDITEWRYLTAGILEGRTEKGTCGVRSGGGEEEGERINKQKAAQNCVSTQPTAAPCLSHIFADVRSLIKNALSRKSTQTPASWRQIYEISQ